MQDSDPYLTDYHIVWRHVVRRAVQDATGEFVAGGPGYVKKCRKEAMQWLLFNNEDFSMVCQFAELEPEGVRRSATEAIGRAALVDQDINRWVSSVAQTHQAQYPGSY